jgi:2-iminobutanoate/2-iminopropanoate deaminase
MAALMGGIAQQNPAREARGMPAPEPIATPSAPSALGPYSPAVRAGEWVVLSGQVGLDPATGKLADGGTEAQARQVLRNVAAVLGDCGLTLRDVAKATVFVTDLGEFATINATYAEAFGDHKPARSTVQVAALPGGATVEIEVWALAR